MSEVRVVELKELGVDYDTFEKIYRMGEEDGRADAIGECIKLVKRECNPYGKPTIDYESGVKIINYLKELKE